MCVRNANKIYLFFEFIFSLIILCILLYSLNKIKFNFTKQLQGCLILLLRLKATSLNNCKKRKRKIEVKFLSKRSEESIFSTYLHLLYAGSFIVLNEIINSLKSGFHFHSLLTEFLEFPYLSMTTEPVILSLMLM